MPRDRFQLISSFLHFNNNDAIPSDCTDKLYKYDQYLNQLLRIGEMYALGEHIAIDEGMLKWRGRLSFAYIIKISQQNMASRLTYWRTLHQVIAGTWTFIIAKKPIKETVMGLLTSKCLGLWHSLYMDNWYTPELSEFLLTAQVHTVGTLENRGSPPEINNPQNMARHDVIARDNGHVMVLAWKDKIVKAISSKHYNSLSP